MSRFLKQVYSQNIYVEFRFQSSLRKYDKKPTKKIKCEAYCKHCINHHKRPQESPSHDCRNKFQSHNKLRRYPQNSKERPSEKSMVSSCMTIKASKQKQALTESQQINALEINVYKDLLDEKQGKKNQVLEKSQQENVSSMEDEIYFNQFQHDVEEQGVKDNLIDQDFVKIQIPKRSNIEEDQNEMKEKISQGFEIQNGSQRVNPQQILPEEASQNSPQGNKNNEKQSCLLAQKIQQELNPSNQESQARLQHEVKASIQLANQVIQSNKIDIFNHQIQQKNIPIELENLELNKQTTSFNDDGESMSSMQIQSAPIIMEQSCLGESIKDKCLAFQGGRIYIDTSGQTFYISVRVFNKLLRKYSDIEELTNVLIHQRPYLQNRKEQIKHQLQEYLRTII